jgi:predicted nucleic acid-binding protein
VLYLLDTNVALYLLKGRLVNPLPPGQYSVSLITEMELLSYPDLTPSEEASIHQFLSQVEICMLTSDVKETAIELRKNHRLKLPDAIIAATAKALGAVLVTNDSKLLSVSEFQTQSTPFI